MSTALFIVHNEEV
uniref:Uncharacterized protein n=1 Tax=Wuchereria bancrofti TaxID=6293 RepID=A0AAF5PLJ2_WUCBA